MAAPAASFSARMPWIPEDDLLLKNAVEAGASLEALAKGAVRFSRRFTVRELRDRWHSLLYDADVSAEASVRMAELELSAANVLSLSSSSKLHKTVTNRENGECSAKRKPEMESIRRMYYAMKKKEKKRRKQYWSECSPDFSLLGAPKVDETGLTCSQNPVGFVVKEEREDMSMEIPSFKQDDLGASIVDGLLELQSSCIVAEMKEAEIVPKVPLWGEHEDTPPSELKVHGSPHDESKGKEAPLGHHDDANGSKNNSSLPDEKNVAIDISTSILESEFAISDSALNSGNEKGLVCMDSDRKDTVDISCIDNVDSVVSSCSNNKHDVEATSVAGSQDAVAKAGLSTASGASPTEWEVATDKHSMNSADVKEPASNLAPSTSSAESNFEEIMCVLNTEDPEVPCNDHIVPSKLRDSSVRQTSSLTGQKDGTVTEKRVVNSVKKDRNVKASLSISQRKCSNTRTVNDTISSGMKCKSFDGKIQVPVFEQASISTGGLNQSRLLKPSPCLTTDGVLNGKFESAPAASSPVATLIPEGDRSTLDAPEFESDEDDVPSFSEIESMILDMDLWPDDQDSYLDREVLRYQSEDSKRVMMRLEQCAKSSTERAIVSRGALALLYGRYLKHYMRDTEVILGRATDDMDVDIDLGLEGPANKISRRQAIIKMEGDGSFLLKNLGKSPMFINGKELPTGQSASLSSSSLIEIRDVAFIFEISSKSVAKFLSRKHGDEQQKHKVKSDLAEVAVP